MSVAAGNLIVANAQRPGDSRHGVSPSPSVILTEDLFRDALVRERNRAVHAFDTAASAADDLLRH